MLFRQGSFLVLLVPLLMLLPLASGHTAATNETFTDPSYVGFAASGPTGVPCETFDVSGRSQTWPPPGTPAGPGAGPTHAMHTAGTAPGATGWHQIYRIDIHRTLRTDTLAAPGLCVLPVPWVSSLTVRYVAMGGGILANPTDLIDVTLRGSAPTLATYVSQSGATFAGGCASSFGGGAPVSPSGFCVLPPVTLGGGGTHEFHLTITAHSPTSMVPASSFPSITARYAFDSEPTPGTPTPGTFHTDQITMTLAF